MSSKEEKQMELTKRIEKLIVDGQREIMGGISHLQNGQNDILARVERFEGEQKEMVETMKKIDKKHDINAEAQYDLMQDVKKDVGEVKEKLHAHLRVPHAVC